LKWETLGVSPNEAQFIQTKELLREDIAAIYGVPVHFLGSSQSERSANLEQKFLEFLTTCLKPNLRRYESELNHKLFSGFGRSANKFFIRFNTQDFERADFANTLKAIQTGRFSGLYTIDEGRKLLGLNPVDPATLKPENPGGSLWAPVNMAPITDEPPPEPVVAAPGDPSQPSVKPAASKPAQASHSFKGIFRDAMGRLLARRKTDKADFTKIFTPILLGMQPVGEDFIVSPESVLMVRNHIEGMHQRHESWDRTDLDKLSDAELALALKTVVEPEEQEDAQQS
jgi:hypothetical protein